MSNTNSNKQNNLVMSFRQKYPEGRIAVNVSQNNGCVMARARIYPNFNDEDRCFLSEITVAKNISENNDFQDLITEVKMQALLENQAKVRNQKLLKKKRVRKKPLIMKWLKTNCKR